jgi:hypothetical protein
MSKIAISPNVSGTGTFTIAAPNSNTDRTLTLPDAGGSVVLNEGSGTFKIDSSGNVGIGKTASTGIKLDVEGKLNLEERLTVDLSDSSGSVFIGDGASSSTSNRYIALYNDNGLRLQTRTDAGVFVSNDYIVDTNATGASAHRWNIANTERMHIDSSGNLAFNSGYGSAAVAYGCRAWVNFNGTGTVAIRAGGNVSSITDNGTGRYSVNFSTNMPDVNYAAIPSGNGNVDTFSTSGSGRQMTMVRSRAVNKVDIQFLNDGGGLADASYATVAIFR